MRITRVSGALGAVIEDVDLRDPDLDFDAVHEAFLEHEVVFFPGANLTSDEQLALGQRFGRPSIYPIMKILGATEPTMTVIADGPDTKSAADHWHTDVTWIAEPPKAALLHMELPSEAGGDTLWCSATGAYDALSPRMQQFCSGLTVEHNTTDFAKKIAERSPDFGEKILDAFARDYPPVHHPLIRTHPETGRRAIFYAREFMSHVVDLAPDESDMLLDFLGDHVKEASLHCRWRWSQGDLAIWDERSTLHRAAGDHWPHERVIRRLEIDGDRPFFEPNA